MKFLVRQTAGSKQKALIALCALGLLANYLHFSLSFGYDFLWGSIIALIAVWLYGARWGALVAGVAALYTVLLWQHPWAMPIFIAEAMFVGIVLRRKSLNILLVDALYWIFLGMPLVWVIYRYALGFDPAQTTVVVLKDAVNGIFNALVASLVITWLQSHKLWNGFADRTSRHQTTSLANILFNLLVGSVLLPTLVFTLVDGRRAQHRTDNEIRDRMETGNLSITGNFESWREVHFSALQSLADLLAVRRMQATPELTDQMALVHRTLPDLQHIAVLNAAGQTVAVYPEREPSQPPAFTPQQTGGLTAQQKGAGGGPMISHVLPGRSNERPAVTITLPIVHGQSRSGHVMASLDLDYIGRMLSWNAHRDKLDAILVDRNHRVVASTGAGRLSGTIYNPESTGSAQSAGARGIIWTPQRYGTAPVQRVRDSYAIREISLPGLPWTLYLQAPYAPHQKYLQGVYTVNLAIMLTLSICALVAAALLSASLARPLHQLAMVSTNLPDKLLHPSDRRPMLWPHSSVVEIDSLTRNFQDMAQTLRDQIHDIQQARLDLAAESARLAEAHRLKDDFLAVLSHELRTPLVPILGYASLIATMPLKPEDTVDAARTIERNARAQLRLIEDLLDVTAILSGKLSLNLGIANVRVLVRDCVDSLKLTAEAKNVKLVTHLGEAALQVPGDEIRIRQIVWNLLSNAIKFTPAGGTVTLRLTESANAIHIEVTDTGAGLDGAFLPHIFDRFRQAEPHLTRSAGGLGLGLFIVKQLVELHGGHIEARSDGLGHGSSFVVSLPARSGLKVTGNDSASPPPTPVTASAPV